VRSASLTKLRFLRSSWLGIVLLVAAGHQFGLAALGMFSDDSTGRTFNYVGRGLGFLVISVMAYRDKLEATRSN
jgi:hypothetical protein